MKIIISYITGLVNRLNKNLIHTDLYIGTLFINVFILYSTYIFNMYVCKNSL